MPLAQVPRTANVLPLLASLSQLTRLALVGAWPLADTFDCSTLRLPQLQLLDLSWSKGRIVTGMLAAAPPTLCTLALDHVHSVAGSEGGNDAIAAHLLRYADSLRVLAMDSLHASAAAKAAILRTMPQLLQLRSLNVADWPYRGEVFEAIKNLPHLQCMVHTASSAQAQPRQAVDQPASDLDVNAMLRRYMWPDMQELDRTGLMVEAPKLRVIGTLPNLTALNFNGLSVLPGSPHVAAALLAPALAQLTRLRRLSLAGFCSSVEAALLVAACATPDLTYLDISAPLNKLEAQAPDFAQLVALTELRVLRSRHVDWRVMGVCAPDVARALAAMPQLTELMLTRPRRRSRPSDAAAEAACLTWLHDALSGAPTALCRLVLFGTLAAPLESSMAGVAWSGGQTVIDFAANSAAKTERAAVDLELGGYAEDAAALRRVSAADEHGNVWQHTRSPTGCSNGAQSDGFSESGSAAALAHAMQEVGVRRFAQLQLFATSHDAMSAQDSHACAASAGLAAGAQIMHVRDCVIADEEQLGVVAAWDDHPRNVLVSHRKFGGSK